MVILEGNSITHYPIAAWPHLRVRCFDLWAQGVRDGALGRPVSITRAVERKVGHARSPPNRVVGFFTPSQGSPDRDATIYY